MMTDDLLSKKWPSKFSGKCNICRQPYEKGEQIQVDPGKPTWYNERAGKEQHNYAHVSCVDGNQRNVAPQAQGSVQQQSTHTRGEIVECLEQFSAGLSMTLEAVDSLLKIAREG